MLARFSLPVHPTAHLETQERSAISAFLASMFLGGYCLVNWLTWGRDVVRLDTWFDRLVPQVPEWIFVYWLAYPCCVLPAVALSLTRLRVLAVAYASTILTSLACFVLMPVYIERPAPPPDAIGLSLVWLTRQLDQPFNCFPSLHVSMDFLAAFFCHSENPALGRSLFAVATMISISTLFVKQHYVLDVVGGFLLAWLAYRLSMKPPVRRWAGD